MRIPGIPALPDGWTERVRFLFSETHMSSGYNARAFFDTQRIVYFLRLWTFGLLSLALTWPGCAAFWGWGYDRVWYAALVLLLALLYLLVWYCIVKHERGHANGIPATGCVGRNKWCVMAEEWMVGHKDGSWLGKAKLLVHQVKGLGRYCGECKQVINRRRA